MDTSTFSPLITIPKPHEKSSLVSSRDPDSVNMLWKFTATIADRVNQLSQNANQQNRDIKQIGDRRILDFDFFPFKIYNLPYPFTTSSMPDPQWRSARIRGGYILSNYISTTGSYVNGTDRMENVADLSILNNNPMFNTITVPTGSFPYWFWIETSGSASGSNSPYYVRRSEERR